MSGNGKTRYEDFLLPEDESVTLPSGMPAKLQYPTQRYFLSIGSLPSLLTRAVSENASLEEIERVDKEDLQQELSREPLSPEHIEAAQLRSDLLLCDVFVEPRFSLTPKEGEFHPKRLQLEDRTFVLQWATAKLKSIRRGGSADLESFCQQPGPDKVADAGK